LPSIASCVGADHREPLNSQINANRSASCSQRSAKEYNEGVVSTIHTTKLAEPKTDPHLQAAGERVKAAAEELERLGIADKNGKRVRTDLPKDMREGADRDFGG